MASYLTRLKRDVERWRQAGHLDEATAAFLISDAESRERRSLSFGNVLAIMAALLFAAAVLIMVAANWEAIPRLVRVGGLFLIILAGYVGGAWLKSRGSYGFAEALWLIAAAAFGGSIALIAQMYHLSGDETAAILTWSIGTAVAAGLLRSGPLTVMAIAIAVYWLLSRGFGFWREIDFPFSYLLVAAVYWALSYWTRSKAARHLILLSLILFACLFVVEADTIVVGIAMTLASALIFAAGVLAPDAADRLVRLDGRLPLHGLLGFLVGMAVTQAYLINETAALALCALVIFGAVAAAVVLAGRESRALRWLAYIGFSVELCFIYVVMMGTMIGTAGLFLLSGVVLGIVAWVITRIERRMRDAPTVAAGVS